MKELRLTCLPTPPRRAVRSLWLEQALRDEVRWAPSVEGTLTADVCIIGGGYAGLWTALALKADDPSLDVAVVEGSLCGSGPSGRNGGFVMSWWSKFSTLKKLCGSEEAVRLARASAEAVAEIGRFCATHGINAEYHGEGWVWTATSPAQVGAWDATLAAIEDSGEAPFERLTVADVARRSCSPVHLAGVFEPTCATVHPGRLCRGLARVAAEQGIRVYENSPVHRLQLGNRPSAHTDRGEVHADRLVLAINAWAAQLEEFKRSLVVVASDVIATECIPERLATIGWDRCVALSDSRRLVNYYRRTEDGRIVFGKGGGTLGYAGRVGPSFHRASPRADDVSSHFHRLYPMLWDVEPVYTWRGPIDYSVTGMPAFVRMQGRPDVVAVAGFSGNGVGPSYIAGRILASMVQEKTDAWASTGLTQLSGALPPEPLRYLGGRAVRATIARKEIIEDAYRRPGRLTSLIAGLDPTSFVDRGSPQAPPQPSASPPVTSDTEPAPDRTASLETADPLVTPHR